MAAVGQDDDADARIEPAPQAVQLVVDQLTVPQAPGFVEDIVFFAVDIVDLAAVSRIGEEQDVSALQFIGGLADFGNHAIAGRFGIDQSGRAVSEVVGDGLHVRRVIDAAAQLAIPSVVGTRVNIIEADMYRSCIRHD